MEKSKAKDGGAGDTTEPLDHDELTESSAAAHAPQSDLEIAEAQRDEFQAQLLRAKADYQNLRRRILEDIDVAVTRETGILMQEMLTVLDYLDMALASPCESPDAKVLLTGVQMTRGQLWQGLERQGVRMIARDGEFNPALHQAMATVDTSDVPPGTIVETVRPGYQKGEQVLRHAQVKVAQKPGGSADPA
ncbi:MAG: nucleotide exchange factor GrpE [Planctomycetota bacterium]